MKQIYIVGAGGFGREVFDWMIETYDFIEEYSFAGFLDDNLQALHGFSIVNPIDPSTHFGQESGQM